MNKLPEGEDTEPLPLSAVSSPDSTISSGSRKRNEREETSLEKHSASSEGGGDDDLSRKKLRLSKEQVAALEEMFKLQSTLNLNQKVMLARQLNLQTRQVEVWFQNRRARTKLKRTEVDYHFLKRRCQDLTEENRRLEKEVAELRARKISPQVYMQMKPSTTLSMCPQCERVAVVPKLSLATSSTPPAATGTSTSGHIIPVGPQDQKTPTVSTWLINRLHENFGSRS